MANIFGIEFPPTGAAPTPPVAAPVFAAAQANPNQQLIPGAFLQYDFTTMIEQNGITVDTTDGVFEIVTTGTYLVTLKTVFTNSSAASAIADARIYVNGTDPAPFMTSGALIEVGGADTLETSNILKLNAGDIVSCVSTCVGAGTPNILLIVGWLLKLA